MGIFYTHHGDPGIYLEWNDTTLNSSTSIDKLILSPPTSLVMYFSGGTTGLVKNFVITGATSSSTSFIDGVVVTSGSLAGSNGAGVLFVRPASAAFTVDEEIQIAGSTVAKARSDVLPIPSVGNPAKSMHLFVRTNSINWTMDGVIPTNDGGTPTSRGTELTSGQSIDIDGVGALWKFKMINSTSGALSVVNATIRY